MFVERIRVYGGLPVPRKEIGKSENREMGVLAQPAVEPDERKRERENSRQSPDGFQEDHKSDTGSEESRHSGAEENPRVNLIA